MYHLIFLLPKHFNSHGTLRKCRQSSGLDAVSTLLIQSSSSECHQVGWLYCKGLCHDEDTTLIYRSLKEIGVFQRLRTQNSQKRELASTDVSSAGALILDFLASRALCLPITLPKEFCYGNLDRQVTASDTCSRKHLTGFWQAVSLPPSTSSSKLW